MRGAPRIQWDTLMITTLVTMRGRGLPLVACAKRIGVAVSVCRRKARELGIAARMRNGPVPR